MDLLNRTAPKIVIPGFVFLLLSVVASGCAFEIGEEEISQPLVSTFVPGDIIYNDSLDDPHADHDGPHTITLIDPAAVREVFAEEIASLKAPQPFRQVGFQMDATSVAG